MNINTSYEPILSNDYQKLWEYVNNGLILVVFINYSSNSQNQDIALIKLDSQINIIVRGLCYFTCEVSMTGYREFIEFCKESELRFIPPFDNNRKESL